MAKLSERLDDMMLHWGDRKIIVGEDGFWDSEEELISKDIVRDFYNQAQALEEALTAAIKRAEEAAGAARHCLAELNAYDGADRNRPKADWDLIRETLNGIAAARGIK